jgi:hypothetical protein
MLVSGGKNCKYSAMDMFLALSVVQQIMTEPSGAATENEKVAIITEAAFSLLGNNAGNSS